MIPEQRSIAIPSPGPDWLVRLAEAIVTAYGGTYRCAETTASVYVSLPGALSDIRLSDHRQHGASLPTHIRPARYPIRSRYGLTVADVIDRAIRAAYAGARRFCDVPPREAACPDLP